MTEAERDPFAFDPAVVPKKLAYQWQPISVFGKTPKGWKPVPWARHRKLFSSTNGKIVVGGMMLMQRNRSEVQGELDGIKHKSIEMERKDCFVDFPYIAGQIAGRNYGGVAGLMTPLPSENYWTDPQPPTATTVSVQIKFNLSARLVDAAAITRLTPEQYGQRLATLIAEGRITGVLVADRDGAFEWFDRFPVIISKSTGLHE